MKRHLIYGVIVALLTPALLPAATAADQNQLRTQDRDRLQTHDRQQIYGSQFMTPRERAQYRAHMRRLRTEREREQYRLQHHREMQERARERGVRLPYQPPPRGGGMGPGPGGGMGPGGGPGR